ncbi:MAG: RNA polymerase factor sigma-54 [Hyphomicrobium sp.]
MALSAKLELRQGQQLVMTPQLQQAIRLLQFSNMELAEFVDAELERNPLLEREENQSASKAADEPSGEPSSEPATESLSGGESGGEDEWLDLRKPVEDPAGALDTDFNNVYQDTGPADAPGAGENASSSWASVRQRMNNGFDDGEGIDAFAAGELSLRDHLASQLPLTISLPAERLIGQYLIDLVDEAGYITSGFDSLSMKLGAPTEMIEGVLNKMQTFDPPGVFARSLAECLALQLKDQNRYDPLMAALLANLDLLAARNLNALRKAVGCDMDDLTDMIHEIKRLNPKPGLKFGSVQMQPVVPDVIVKPASDGGWHVELNSDTLPRVLLNRNYYTRVSKTASNEKDKGYLLECLQTANWLLKSLDQRARTILRVAEQIVRQQDGFFMYGVQHLRPLNLKTIADAISMHESTVSRVTSNKYISTPRGIFELKYFFTSAIASSDDGEAHSSEAVRHRIKQMIDAESADDILSDDKLVDKLRDDGIDIARRTVAKYREALRIPSSVQRRRDKRLFERMGGTI